MAPPPGWPPETSGAAGRLTLPPALYRRVVHPVLLRMSGGRRRRALERMEVFFPYFENRASYDNRRTRERLERAGVRTTPLEGYFGRLLDFADRARWGRKPISRARARAQAARGHGSTRSSRRPERMSA